jgi:Tol biopolymer transport system component
VVARRAADRVRRQLYERTVHGVPRSHDDLYVVNRDGSGRVRVASHIGKAGYGEMFAWAPDGRRLAVSVGSVPGRSTRSSLELYVIDLRGRRTRRLTHNHVFDGLPAWRGAQLLYVRQPRIVGADHKPLIAEDVRRLDAGLTRDRLVRRLAVDRHQVRLVTAPDGQTVAVLATTAQLLDVRSGRLTTLAAFDGLLLEGAWSPDSRRFALPNGYTLDVVDVATKHASTSPPTTGDCTQLDWSPDGAWLVCSSLHGEGDERRGTSDLLFTDTTTGARVTPMHEPSPFDGEPSRAPLS